MSNIRAKLFLLVLLAAGSARAQSPTGAIAGVVIDPAGAPVAWVRVSTTNRVTGLIRNLTTSTEGDYSAPALPPGVYQMAAEAAGFTLLERTATVEAGTTTTVKVSWQTYGRNKKEDAAGQLQGRRVTFPAKSGMEGGATQLAPALTLR